MKNVRSVLGTIRFLFNEYGSLVINSLQSLEHRGKVDPSLPERNFLAERPGVRWKKSVLGMDSAHQVAKYVHGIHRIALPAHNDVGHIEIYKDITEPDVFDHAQKGGWRFFSGFTKERATALFAVSGDEFHRAYGFGI